MGYANGYQTTLTASATNSATSITVASVAGIPALPFKAVIAAEGSNTDELVMVTGVSSLTLTVVRAIELSGGNGASAHGSGAFLANTMTAGDFTPTDAAGAIYGYKTFR